eukprot:jgi/Tetstr1/462870/TSEL_007819.t1
MSAAAQGRIWCVSNDKQYRLQAASGNLNLNLLNLVLLPAWPGATVAGGRAGPRCVVHVDLDCFYCQVEARANPALRGKPVAVMQYNPWEAGGRVTTRGAQDERIDNASNGSLIAVSYEARAAGVKRNMRGAEARRLCPELVLVQVPTAHGKSDMQLYRDAGEEVAAVLGRRADALEKASVDESYVDVTGAAAELLDRLPLAEVLRAAAGTHVAGEEEVPGGEPRAPAGEAPLAAWLQRPEAEWDRQEQLLAAGCALLHSLRAAVTAETGFTCSAGLAENKLMAKLGSGMHKPNQQTVLPRAAVPALMEHLPVRRLRGLGGKLGERVQQSLAVETASQLAAVEPAVLQREFGAKTGAWLARVARGCDDEPVKERRMNDSVSNGKRFDSSQTITSLEAGCEWLRELVGEVHARLAVMQDRHGRAPKTISLSISADGERNATGFTSRSCAYRPGLEPMVADACALLSSWAASPARQRGPLAIHGLFVTAHSFHSLPGRDSQDLRKLFMQRHDEAPGRAANALNCDDATPPGTNPIADLSFDTSSEIAGAVPSSRTRASPGIMQQFLANNNNDKIRIANTPTTPSTAIRRENDTPHNEPSLPPTPEATSDAPGTPAAVSPRDTSRSPYLAAFGTPQPRKAPVDGVHGDCAAQAAAADSHGEEPPTHSSITQEASGAFAVGVMPRSMDDVDDDVFRELPLHIRHEIMAAMPDLRQSGGIAPRPPARGGSAGRKRKAGREGQAEAGPPSRGIQAFFTAKPKKHQADP